MDRQQKIMIAVLGAVLAAVLVALIVVVASRRPEIIVNDFETPPFEENALSGAPAEAADMPDYREITVEGSYTFALRGAPVLDGDRLLLYFTSHKDNDAWLLIRVYDMDGTQLGTSGLLRAGKYVEAVTLSAPPAGETVRVKVLSYEPGTYYSKGAASATLPVTQPVS